MPTCFIQVQELKDELKCRGLVVQGNKAVLRERLMEALAAEESAPANDDEAMGHGEDEEDSDDAADPSYEQKTPTNGAMSSDEVGERANCV